MRPLRAKRPLKPALANTMLANTKEAAPMGSLSDLIGFQPCGLPFRPAIAVPVTAAFMLAECHARTAAPIIFMNHDACFARIFKTIVGVPAHIALTDNCSRRADAGQRQQSCAKRRAEQTLADRCHLV